MHTAIKLDSYWSWSIKGKQPTIYRG